MDIYKILKKEIINMEYEVRYYFPTEKLKKIISKLQKFSNLDSNERCYEKTIQFDHPNA